MMKFYPPELPAARLLSLTDEDTLIWARLNYQFHPRQPGLFGLLLYRSFEMDEGDFRLLQAAQKHKDCWAHWASWRRHSVMLRGAGTWIYDANRPPATLGKS